MTDGNEAAATRGAPGLRGPEPRRFGARRRALGALLGVAALGLAACSTTSEVTALTPKTGTIPPQSIVALDVRNIDGDAEGAEVAGRVRDRLFGKIVSRGKFSQVVPKGSAAPYAMDVAISGVNKVSTGARIFAGVFAGGDELAATVTIRDASTNVVVNQFGVSTEAAAHWMSSDYGIDSAIEQLTDKVVEGI